ncbi:MAG: cardiolipin synthase [Bacteroidales bacterium]|nr:cardiolipin synthase [Bacteroidales bacterium]
MFTGIFRIFSHQGWGWFVLDLIMLVTILVIVVVIILENKDPVKTIAWILILMLIPVGGIIFYFYLGRNPRKRKLINEKVFTDHISLDLMAKKQLVELHARKFIKDERLAPMRYMMQLLLSNSKALITKHNRIKVLHNGRQTFGSIIYELEHATDHIHLEFFIIEEDQIGNRIKDILVKKAREWAAVRVHDDDSGRWPLSRKFIRELTSAGAGVASFMPVKSYIFANKVNFRLHRKIIVIDGRVGFVGGINIAERYLRGLGRDNLWRDTHLRIEGDAVASLQAVFLMDWGFVSGSIENDLRYFPASHIEEHQLVQIVASGPDSDWESIMQAYFSAINRANHYVYISTPYFLPNESIRMAMKTAALSGVDVRILLPEKCDSWMVGMSSRSYLKELLLAGVKVYFYMKGFTHSKLMIVDDIFSSVGTANMDIRSFNQDFEVNALIYGESVAVKLKKNFLEDISFSRELNISEWESRPVHEKVQESLARIFSPLL